jgi:polar amino acid transport system ATP-binding protein
MVFQQYNLFPHRTALQNVMMAPIEVLKRPRKEVEADAYELLKKVTAGWEGTRLSGRALRGPAATRGDRPFACYAA